MNNINQAVPLTKRKLDDTNLDQNKAGINVEFNKNDFVLVEGQQSSLKFGFYNDEGVCGLENVVEYKIEPPHEPKYECTICDMLFDAKKIINHLKEATHFSTYIRNKPNGHQLLIQEFRPVLCRTLKQQYEANSKQSWLNQVIVKTRMPGLLSKPNNFFKKEYVVSRYSETLLNFGHDTDLICGLEDIVEYRLAAKRYKYECVLCDCITDGKITMICHLKGTKHFANCFQKYIDRNQLYLLNNQNFKTFFCKNLKIRIEDTSKKSWLHLVQVKKLKETKDQTKKIKFETDLKNNQTHTEPMKIPIENIIANISKQPEQQQQQRSTVFKMKIQSHTKPVFCNIFDQNPSANFKDAVILFDDNNNREYNDVDDRNIFQIYPQLRLMFNIENLIQNQSHLQNAEDFLKRLNDDI